VALKHRGRGCYKKDPQAPWVVGIKGQTATQGNALPKAPEYYIDYTDSQLPVSDKWIYVEPEYPEV